MAETKENSGATSKDDAPNDTFMIPRKEINMVTDMGKWKQSQAYADYMGFVLSLNKVVKGKKLTCEYKVSETVQKLLQLLGTLEQWIIETPPVDQPSRFGNKAYRTWFSKLDQSTENLMFLCCFLSNTLSVIYSSKYRNLTVNESIILDYMNKHEQMVCVCVCGRCGGIIVSVDSTLSMIFRNMQSLFIDTLEFPGDEGSWCINVFIPTLAFGPQSTDHPTLEPRHFIDAKVVNEHHQDYMFLDCIKFINEMKTGPFAEHSNQLWNISAVHSWSKVNQGLIKMYRAECLEKFPVIQHFKFGSLLSIQPVKP
uniref:Serine/threonine-protein phosphatase 2A activator n=1 Tax=Tetraodon nigroviridis TaxID=99883 RepID=H3CP27_TETNG